jgi:hypothetical protein
VVDVELVVEFVELDGIAWTVLLVLLLTAVGEFEAAVVVVASFFVIKI